MYVVMPNATWVEGIATYQANHSKYSKSSLDSSTIMAVCFVIANYKLSPLPTT